MWETLQRDSWAPAAWNPKSGVFGCRGFGKTCQGLPRPTRPGNDRPRPSSLQSTWPARPPTTQPVTSQGLTAGSRSRTRALARPPISPPAAPGTSGPAACRAMRWSGQLSDPGLLDIIERWAAASGPGVLVQDAAGTVLPCSATTGCLSPSEAAFAAGHSCQGPPGVVLEVVAAIIEVIRVLLREDHRSAPGLFALEEYASTVRPAQLATIKFLTVCSTVCSCLSLQDLTKISGVGRADRLTNPSPAHGVQHEELHSSCLLTTAAFSSPVLLEALGHCVPGVVHPPVGVRRPPSAARARDVGRGVVDLQ